MTTSMRVRYDGKVLVPQEQVDLPVGQELIVHIDSAHADEQAEAASLANLAQWAKQLPPLESNDSNGPPPRDRAAQHDHYLYGTPKRD